MWECPMLPNEWQYHLHAALSFGLQNAADTDISYDVDKNETKGTK